MYKTNTILAQIVKEYLKVSLIVITMYVCLLFVAIICITCMCIWGTWAIGILLFAIECIVFVFIVDAERNNTNLTAIYKTGLEINNRHATTRQRERNLDHIFDIDDTTPVNI